MLRWLALSMGVLSLLYLPACGARSALDGAPDGAVPGNDVVRVDIPVIDRPTVDVTRVDIPVFRDTPTPQDVQPMVTVVCPAPILSARQTDTVSLAAMASSNVGLPLTYVWQVRTRPTASMAVPLPADALTTMFTFDTGGDWVLGFTATDTQGHSASCTVDLTAQPAINLLCPDDQSNYQGATVPLDAVASSNFGRAITLAWSVVSRPTGSMTAPTPVDSANASMLLDQLGDWHLQLVATDTTGLTSTCTTSVHADPDVIVMCPPDTTSAPFATVNLTATASSRLHLPLTYLWQFVTQPITSTAPIPSPTTLSTPFTFDVAGNWTWRFTATNSRGNSASCTTRALAQSTEAVRAELVWNVGGTCVGCNAQGGGQDLDLHMTFDMESMGHFADAAPDNSDCYYANCRCGMPGMLCTTAMIDWPPPGNVNDPQLDDDHIEDLPGPENINIVTAASGYTFDVAAHFYSSHGNTSTVSPTVVRVYCSGTLVFQSEVVQFSEGSDPGIDSEDPSMHNLWRVGTITTLPGGGCTFTRCGSPGNLSSCIQPEANW